MNVEIGAEAARFPEKEYINVIAVAVHCALVRCKHLSSPPFVLNGTLRTPTPSPVPSKI